MSESAENLCVSLVLRAAVLVLLAFVRSRLRADVFCRSSNAPPCGVNGRAVYGRVV